MHEFSIAESILKAAKAEAEACDATKKILKVGVAVGKMRQVVPDFLTFAFETVAKDGIADGASLEIHTLPIKIECNDCKWTGELDDPIFICAECECRDVEVIGGMELKLEKVEIED